MATPVAEVIIDRHGNLRFIHADDLTEAVKEMGTIHIKRASTVEPTADGKWQADMAPVGGPKLEAYARREDALRREVVWLEDNDIPLPK